MSKKIFILLFILSLILFSFLIEEKEKKSQIVIASPDVATYDFTNSTDNKAYKTTAGGTTPKIPGDSSYTEYTSTQYSNTKANDSLRNAWSGAAGGYINLWYKFKINQSISSITQIDLTWIGYDTLSDDNDFELDVWNKTTSQWDLWYRTTTAKSSDQTYTKTYTSGFSDIIDANGYLQIGASGGFIPEACFLKGTKIKMADGFFKPIEEVKIGDEVISYDESNGKLVRAEVEKVFYHSPDQMGDYYLIINQDLRLTPNHPLYINGKWLPVQKAQIGDTLLDIEGNKILITSIEKIFQKVPTYNLEAKGYHNYFAEGILAHNKSLAEGTLVSMADGSFKPIEEVKMGDKVLSWDFNLKKAVPALVKSTWSDYEGNIYLIKTEKNEIKATFVHPFWTKEVGWASIDPDETFKNYGLKLEKLKVGYHLMDTNGKWIRINSILEKPGKEKTYNLNGIEGYHNYFAGGVLVHNKIECPSIYSFDGSDYRFETDVLIKPSPFLGKEKENSSYDILKHIKEPKIKITNILTPDWPELHYINSVKLKVTDTKGENKKISILNPISITKKSSSQEDLLSLIREMDNKYLIMEEGDEYFVEFEPFPEKTEGFEREIGILASGYYEKLYPEPEELNQSILLAGGGYGNIKNLKPGDYIKSFDPNTQRFFNSQIKEISCEYEKDYLVINNTLKVVENQKIYLNDEFQKAEKATLGDFLLNEKGEKVEISSIKTIPQKVQICYPLLDSSENFFTGGYLVKTKSNSHTLYENYVMVAVTYSPISVSGTCKQYDQSTNCADGKTIRVAIGGALQSQTGTTSSGSWSIPGVSPPSLGAIITVFIDGADDANEAVAVTKYVVSGNITGINLYERHLSIGSDSNPTINNSDLSQYNYSVSGDEDIFFDVDTSFNLTMPASGTSTYTDQRLIIKANNIYRPDSAAARTITVPNLKIPSGATLTADGNTFVLTASGTPFNVSGTFNYDTSTVNYSGPDEMLVTPIAYYNLTSTTPGKRLKFVSGQTVTINGTLTLNGGNCNTRLILRSTVDGSYWNIDVSNASRIVNYVDVKDSNAIIDTIKINATNSANSGNNNNWIIDPGSCVGLARLLGWAWSDKIGWISFNSANCDPDGDEYSNGEGACPQEGTKISSYGVNLPMSPDIAGRRFFSGYAWAGGGIDAAGNSLPTIGWIRFDPPASQPAGVDCEASPAYLDDTSKIPYGFIRACGGINPEIPPNPEDCNGPNNPAAGGWDGWICIKDEPFNGDQYNLYLNTISNQFEGWSWGGGGNDTTDEAKRESAIIGWISWNCLNQGVCGSSNYYVYYQTGNQQPGKPTGLNPNLNCCAWGSSSQVCPGCALTLNWDYTDPDGDTQGGYEIWIDEDSNHDTICDNSDFIDPKFNYTVEGVGAHSYTVNLSADTDWYAFLSLNTRYCWKVRVKDNRGAWSEWSDVDTFTTPLHSYPYINFGHCPAEIRVGENVQFCSVEEGNCDGICDVLSPATQTVCYTDDNANQGPNYCTSFSWTFELGEPVPPSTTSDQNPVAKLLAAGQRKISLKVTDSNYSCPKEETLTVQLSLPEWREIPPF